MKIVVDDSRPWMQIAVSGSLYQLYIVLFRQSPLTVVQFINVFILVPFLVIVVVVVVVDIGQM